MLSLTALLLRSWARELILKQVMFHGKTVQILELFCKNEKIKANLFLGALNTFTGNCDSMCEQPINVAMTSECPQ